MTYTTSELSAVVGVPEGAVRRLIHRGQFVPEHRRSGRGHAAGFTRTDVLQLAFILALQNADVSLQRAPSFWRVVSSQTDVSNLGLYVLERPDGHDTDFVMAPADGLRPGEVPPTATLIDVGDLQRQISWNLDQIDARRVATDFANYPHRFPFLAPDPDAPWSIFLANEAGSPDANAIARMQDAVEARSNILLAGATRDAMLHLVAVVDRMLNASTVKASEHAA